jgi:inorganic pyrophosphatase
LIGVIEAEQTEDGKTERNDRLIAVAENSHTHREVQSLDQISDNLIGEIEHFFISYNTIKGKGFKPIGRYGLERAAKLIEEGVKRLSGKSSGVAKKGKAKASKSRTK